MDIFGIAVTATHPADFFGNYVDVVVETWFTLFMAATHNPTTDREVAVKHSTTITAVPASEAGALPGFAIVCTCGDRHSLAFEGMAVEYAAKHVAYMAKKGR